MSSETVAHCEVYLRLQYIDLYKYIDIARCIEDLFVITYNYL